MTKINLLPDYIWEVKRRKRVLMMVIAALLVEAVLLAFLVMSSRQKLDDATTARDAAQKSADAEQAIEKQAQAMESSIKPITDKTAYVQNVLKYDQQFPDLFDRTNIYTYSRVGYRQLQPQQTVLNVTAYARNVSDIGRYLLNIQRAKNVFTTVSITSQLPGWPPGSTAGGGSSYSPPPTPAGYGPGSFGPGSSPYGPGGGAVTVANPTGPTPIEFTAVGQLVKEFQFSPPVYAAAGATDTSGGGLGSYSGGGPGGPAGFGPSGPPRPPGPGPGGGGGSNGGGSNGGSS